MSKKPLFVHGAIIALLLPLALASILALVWTVGTTREGEWFPVTSRAALISAEPFDGGALVYFQFTKVRECEFIGLSWFKGQPDGVFDRVRINFNGDGDDSGSTRPRGTQIAGPWFIDIPPNELQANSFAIVRHRCHPFWQTSTIFYP